MSYSDLPAFVLLYVWVGFLITFTTWSLWAKRATTPLLVHAFFFPVHTLSGRQYIRMPLVDHAIDYWYLRSGVAKRYAVVALYCLAAILFWPLKFVWPFVCLSVAILCAVLLLCVVIVCTISGCISCYVRDRVDNQ